MSMYIIIFAFISVLNFFSWRVKSFRPFVLFVSFLLLILVSGMRDFTVGIDTKNYLALFNSIVQNGPNFKDIGLSTLFIPAGFEIGFVTYTYLVSLITDNFVLYLMITSSLIYVPVYLFIKRYSTDYYLSFIIYYCLFFFGSMSLLRQSIAMSIILSATKFIIIRKPLKFIAMVLLATSFHVSALIALVLYPIYNKKLTRFTATLALAWSSILFVAMGVLVKIAATINYRYEFYLDRIDSFSVASYISVCLYLFIFFLLLVLKNNDTSKAREIIKQNFLLITSFAATIVMALSIKVNSLDRLSLIFLIYSIISIPLFLTSSKINIKSGYIKLLLVCTFISYAMVILIVKPEWYGVSAYSTSVELLGN